MRIIARALIVLLACCCLLQQAKAQAPSPREQQLAEWTTYYYVYKDSTKVADSLKSLQEIQMLERRPGAVGSFVGFHAELFSSNPTQVRSWVAGSGATGKTRDAISYALWLSGNGNLIAEVFNDNPDYATRKPVSLLDARLRHAGDLDMMWGAFSASGNVAYVKKLIDAMDGMDPVTRGAAEWSLRSNMVQHELVDRLVRREIASRSDAIKGRLEQMAARNDASKKGFPDKDGEFSAMLAITEEQALAEFEKPSSQTPVLREKLKVQIGDVIVIKVLFAGIQLTDDLRGDVTFDMKIIEPDGTVKEAGMKDLEGFRGKVPTRFRVFNNLGFIKLKFDSSDRPGKVRVLAEVRDNVGSKKVQLEKQIEVMP